MVRVSPHPLDDALADLAIAQHGVVALAQLRALGFSERAVRGRVGRRRLYGLHEGVYAFGRPDLNPRGRWLAAVLACGHGAVLSYASAAALWELRRTSQAAIDVTIQGASGRRRSEIRIHRSRTLAPDEVTTLDAIPCTTVARTLVDLADVLPHRKLERALEQADVLRLLDAKALERSLSRARGRHGAPALRVIVAQALADPTASITRSELEELFLSLCRAEGIPRPRVNQQIALPDGSAIEVDFHWPTQRLVVETDGHAYHRTRQAFERDRKRDQRLQLAGWRPVRFTWWQIARDPNQVASTTLALLNR
ncbi:MAG: hypothetical protein DLM63_06115 [Solirubrobacterales bacterium]|nr:MAG: hypothetical protein DLM63_06115 [Solirubrobacterales bacterium]